MIEIINPEGKIIGSESFTLDTTSFQKNIKVDDWSVPGSYLIHLTYKNLVYEEDFVPTIKFPTINEVSDCRFSQLESSLPDIDSEILYYEIPNREEIYLNKATENLLKIRLGNEIWQVYEPIISKEAIIDNRADTEYAFEKINEFEKILINKTSDKLADNLSQIIEIIQQSEIRIDKKENLIREYKEKEKLIIENYINEINLIIDSIKKGYNYWDEWDQKIKESQDEEAQIETKPIFDTTIKKRVPGWIKNNAGWWADGQINDRDFVGGIQHMIKKKIINIPDLPEQASTTAEEKIPDWIKNNAAWWANGMISEDDFVNGIKYLVENGIIRVS